MSLGFFVVALLLVWAVAGASAVFLARRDLAATVDSAALAVAQEVDLNGVYTSGAESDLPLDADAVSAAIAALNDRDAAPSGIPTQRLSGGVNLDGRTVVVRGEREVRLPVFGTVTVTAFAHATSHRRTVIAP